MRTAAYVAILVGLLGLNESARSANVLETDNLRLSLSADAKLTGLTSKPDGIELAAAAAAKEPIAMVFRGEEEFPATSLKLDGDRMTVGFETAGVTAVFDITKKKEYLAFKLASLTGEPVDRIEFMRLAVKPKPHVGYWINTIYDDRFGVCLCAANPATDAVILPRALTIDESRPEVFDAMSAERLAERDHFLIRGFAEKAVCLEGAEVVLFGFSRPEGIDFLDPADPFLDVMEVVERDYGMPSGAKFRRDSAQSASWLEVSGATTANIDQYIEMAKRGGFRILKINWSDFSSGPGHYTWNDPYPNGMADLKAVVDRIHAAGLKSGLHLHYCKATKQDAYVTPIPDDRLGKVRHFTLANDIDEKQDTIAVNEDPAGCTKDAGRCILKLGRELVCYKDYTTEPPFRFTGCERGHLQTTAAAHDAKAPMALLDVDSWPLFIRYAQDNDIQDETGRRFAKIHAQGGPFDMIYFDGAEDVPDPLWHHVPNAQLRMFRLLDPVPVLCEAAVNGHYNWHMNPRSNAYDAVDAKVYKSFCQKVIARTAPLRATDFSRCAFGWLYGFEYTPDTLEYVTSRAAAWDCPCCYLIPSLATIKANPRWEDCLDVIKIWEDIRADKKLTDAHRTMLRTLGPECYRDCDACEHHIFNNVRNEPGLSDAARKKLLEPDQEHHLFRNETGECELVEIHPIPSVLFDTLTAYWFARASRPGDTYVLIWSKAGSTDLRLPVAGEQFVAMRPFGEAIEVQSKDKESTVEVCRRMYLVFSGMQPEAVRKMIGESTSERTQRLVEYVQASAFSSQSGDFVKTSETKAAPSGALSDCIVPTVDGTFEAWEKCHVDYKIQVPKKGLYRVWARMWSENEASNSFFVSLPGQTYPKTIFGNQPIWKKWHWQPGPVMNLEEGETTIRFWVRDAIPKQGPFLDVICFTNLPSYVPSDEEAVAATK